MLKQTMGREANLEPSVFDECDNNEVSARFEDLEYCRRYVRFAHNLEEALAAHDVRDDQRTRCHLHEDDERDLSERQVAEMPPAHGAQREVKTLDFRVHSCTEPRAAYESPLCLQPAAHATLAFDGPRVHVPLRIYHKW